MEAMEQDSPRPVYFSVETLSSNTTVSDLLAAVNLMPLLDTFTSHSITSLQQIQPDVLEKMELPRGVRMRILKAVVDARKSDGNPGMVDSAGFDQAMMPPPPARPPAASSTSSLYIASTIAQPDLVQICFCVSLVIHDLVAEAEHALKSRPADGRRPPMPRGDPYSLFKPRNIFSLPGKRSRSVYEDTAPPVEEPGVDIPTEDDIRTSIAAVHEHSRFSPGCLVVALIYIERLRRSAGALLLASTWQPTLLIAIIVAQKVWEDKPHLLVDFTPLCPALTLQQLNELERDFLRLLDYNVGVKASIYTEWYFRLSALCERSSIRLRPLDAEEARKLEIKASLYEGRLQRGPRWHSAPLNDGDGGKSSRVVLS